MSTASLARFPRRSAAFLFAGALTTTGIAAAQSCGGFSDVFPADFYCNNVEWLKNRGVTLGCTATSYCPLAPVNRGAMAAFMNRLGVALTPQPILVQSAPGGINLDTVPVMCVTTDVAPANYPRTMLGTWHFAGLTGGALAAWGRVVVSNDAGSAWNELVNPTSMRVQTDSSQWTSLSGAGTYDIAVGEVARFALKLGRQSGGGSAQFADSSCQLSLQVVNRNPGSAPF